MSYSNNYESANDGSKEYDSSNQPSAGFNKQKNYGKKRIIIDATYQKGIRVATVIDSSLEHFDFEMQDKGQVRGNIYLGKVIRIEQSLQAAFVDFGIGKNGFLPFAEIHPDYYQISAEDKNDIIRQMKTDYEDPSFAVEDTERQDGSSQRNDEADLGLTNSIKDNITQESSYDLKKFESIIKNKKYKISDVLKKDQLVLVQVLKEERGNKGATLTTYISIAGKYLVFMPNSLKGNGISRKIELPDERRRIKTLLSSFQIPVTASVVARTAAQGIDNDNLKKDCDYLLSLWNSIREKTLKSEAPSFIHEEDDILRRVIRDYCDTKTSEIIVEGEDAFKQVKQYADTLIASNVKLINYFGKLTAFAKYGVDEKIDELFTPRANLPSGGYLIIQQTEALVSVDINSGKATGEQNIEETALKTNLEAVEEIARQIRLRNLSGLIVIDFIDMMRFANKKTIERAMKIVMQQDKVRVQTGRISQFGLLEISRQRTRPSFLEIAGIPCQHCASTGFIKSLEYTAATLIRTLDANIRDELVKSSGNLANTHVNTTHELGSYVLNYKRQSLSSLEKTYGVSIFINSGRSQKDDDFWFVFEQKKQNGNEFRSYESEKSKDMFYIPNINEDVIEGYNDKGMDVSAINGEAGAESTKSGVSFFGFAVRPFSFVFKIAKLVFGGGNSSKSKKIKYKPSKKNNRSSKPDRRRGGRRR